MWQQKSTRFPSKQFLVVLMREFPVYATPLLFGILKNI